MSYPEETKHRCSARGATFFLRIHFKQNSNWQGTIQWLEVDQTIPFRSVLELNMLINEAVENTRFENDERGYRSWKLTGKHGQVFRKLEGKEEQK